MAKWVNDSNIYIYIYIYIYMVVREKERGVGYSREDLWQRKYEKSVKQAIEMEDIWKE